MVLRLHYKDIALSVRYIPLEPLGASEGSEKRGVFFKTLNENE
jgi:hypothetical protein